MRNAVPQDGADSGPVLPPDIEEAWVEEILRWVEDKRGIRRVLLHGSRVRGSSPPGSDLEIAVLVDAGDVEHDGGDRPLPGSLFALWQSELQGAVRNVRIALAVIDPGAAGALGDSIPIFTRLTYPAFLEATA